MAEVTNLKVLFPVTGSGKVQHVRSATGEGNPNDSQVLNDPTKFAAGSTYINVVTGVMYYAQDRNRDENRWYVVGTAPATDDSVSE